MQYNPETIRQFYGGGDLYPDFAADAAVKALAGVVQFKTIADADHSKIPHEPFLEMHKYLESAFPLVHKLLQKTVVHELSLLYYWPGSDPSLKPIMLMGHMDVVPVVAGTEQDWDHPPYSGEIADGFIWGRGSSDCKSKVIASLSAVEYYLQKGLTPKRGIYLAFGHDEEVMGVNGAGHIMQHLKAQGVTLEFLVDEGGGFMLADDYGAPGVLCSKIDIFEKGYLDIALTVNDPGGHSSRPGKGTALGKVAKAIVALEANQFPPQMSDVVRSMFTTLAPHVTVEPLKTYFSDLTKYEPELIEYMMADRKLAPMLHTTIAATMISGSPAPNVLPQKVEAIVNLRLAPQDTVESVIAYCERVIDDPDVKVSVVKGRNPSGIAKAESYGMDILREASEVFFPGLIPMSGLIMGGTDACHFEDICECCYRFGPFMDGLFLGHTVHGTNERVVIDDFVHGCKVYLYYLEKACF